ncbi:MAG: DUF86 domain-containing protein [Deltaproteobacteria bacterium]|nr:DUF86 domain-containing protein [Deltaproteobacteria bacterium]
MPRRDWIERIEDILDSIRRIRSYVEGMDFDAFFRDRRTSDAVLWNIMVIGEAARNVPEEVRVRYPGIPWEDMRGIRNVIVHEYFGVSLSILWQTVESNLPPLVTALEKIRDENEPG